MPVKIKEWMMMIPFIILAINGFVGYSFYQSSNKHLLAEQWVRHTDQVIYQSSAICAIASNLETSCSIFAITNDNTFIKSITQTQNDAALSINVLDKLVSDNPIQKPAVDSLAIYIQKII